MMWARFGEAIAQERRRRATLRLGGLAVSSEDWRVTGRGRQSRLTCYASSKAEALRDVAYLRGLGYKGVRCYQVA